MKKKSFRLILVILTGITAILSIVNSVLGFIHSRDTVDQILQVSAAVLFLIIFFVYLYRYCSNNWKD